LFVHPVDGHGTTHVSGISLEVRGARAPEEIEDVAAEAVVVAKPRARLVVARPLGHAGEIQPQIAHRSHQRAVLEQRA